MRRLHILSILFFLAFGVKAQVVINEIGIAPSSGNAGQGGEFIELYNTSSCAVNIGCYVIVYSGTSGTGNATGWTVTIPSGTILVACSYYLIGGGGIISSFNQSWSNSNSGGNPWINTSGAMGKDDADLDISKPASKNSSKQSTIPGNLNDNSGQVTLFTSTGSFASSISYNSGNNPGTFPAIPNTTGCAANTSLSNPGTTNNVDAPFQSGAPNRQRGIYLDASGNYQPQTLFTPGYSNELNGGSQLPCEPLPQAPTLLVVNNCNGTSTLTASNYTGTLTWNDGGTGNPRTVSAQSSFSVTQTINGCTSAPSNTVNAQPGNAPQPPTLEVVNNCNGTSTLTASNYTGTLTWNDGGTGNPRSVSAQGSFSVTQTINGCTSAPSTTVNAQPGIIPTVTVNSPSICPGAIATIIATPSPGGNYIYEWTVPAGVTNPGDVDRFETNVEGEYLVVVTTIVGGCTATASGTLSITSQAQVTADSKEVCVGNTVTLTGQPSGGTWSGTGVNGSIFNSAGLSAGVYTITYTIQNAAGCGGTKTATVTINNYPLINAGTYSAVCINQTAIQLEGTPTGGVFSGTGVSNNIFNPATAGVGTHTITYSYSANNCTSFASTSILVNNSGSITLTSAASTTSQTICSLSDISRITYAIGGSANNASVNGLPAGVSGSFSGGIFTIQGKPTEKGIFNYTVTTTGATCLNPSLSGVIHVIETPTAHLTLIDGSSEAIICAGESIQLSISLTGTPLWVYQIFQNNLSTNTGYSTSSSPAIRTFKPINSSIYSLGPILWDEDGCPGMVSGTVTITVNSIGAISSHAEPIPCGANAGTITVTASGGTAPFTYSINGGPFVSSNVFTGLSGGSYSITIKDAAGCTTSTSVTINQSNSTVQATAIADPIPCGANASTITVTASGGTAPYTYSINSGAFGTSNVFTGISAGIFNIIARDANGCEGTTSVTIAQLISTVQATATADPISCGGSTGTITVTASGGTAPYTYSINNGAFGTSNVFAGISAGIFNIIALDANGCEGTTSVTITQSISTVQATATADPISCGGSTGTITVTASGGTAPYTYSINGGLFESSNIFTDLPAGTYTVTVKDAGGCTSNISATVIQTTSNIIVSLSTNPIPCSATTGSISVTVTGGTAPYEYSINQVDFVTSHVFTNLAAGGYTITVKDVFGCAGNASIFITQQFSTVSATASTEPIPCGVSSGTITVTASGGTSPYSFSLNGGPFGSSNSFIGLPAGVYTVTVKDAAGCDATIPVNLTQAPSTISASASVTSIPCDQTTGTITINATGGVPPYFYSLDGNLFQSSNVFASLPPGSYYFTIKDAFGCTTLITSTLNRITGFSLNVTVSPNPEFAGKQLFAQTASNASYKIISWQPVHLFSNQTSKSQTFRTDTSVRISVIGISANGCLDTAYFNVVVLPLDDIFIPTGFTPNGDGKNDVFRIYGEIADLQLNIFNRWGQLLFRSTEISKGWDGKFKGDLQPSGVYIIIVTGKNKDGNPVKRNGTLTLIR